MKVACTYHPTKAAHFTCHECTGSFCEECVSDRSFQKYGRTEAAYYCPKCNVPAINLGMGNILPPFWQRIPSFFVYPFRLQPLFFMMALATVATVFPRSFLVSLFSGITLIKYSYAVLTNTAHGNLGSPKDFTKIVGGDIDIVFKQFGIFVAMFFGFAWFAKSFGVLAGLLFVGFAILSVPAMIMSLAATESLIQALNPMVFVRIMSRIGWPYLLMYLFLLMMSGGPAALAPYIVGALSPIVQVFLFSFAKMYYTILSYNLMGYVLLQYQEEIGYEVDYEEVKKHTIPDKKGGGGVTSGDNEIKILEEVEKNVMDGRIDEAIQFIQSETQGKIEGVPLAKRFYDLLKIAKRKNELVKHCKVYIDVLVKKVMFSEVIRIYKEGLAINPQFIPNADSLYKIAEWMSRSGDAKNAMNMAVKFIKLNPTHALTPEAYYLIAQILHERLNNIPKAREILKAIVSKYPDHDLAGKANNYLQQLG